jgi:hypothetical protein
MQAYAALRRREARALGRAWCHDAPGAHETRRLAVYLWRLERTMTARCVTRSPTPEVLRIARIFAALAPICWLASFARVWRPRCFAVEEKQPRRAAEPGAQVAARFAAPFFHDVSPHDFVSGYCNN